MTQFICPRNGEICEIEVCEARKTYIDHVEETGEHLLSDVLSRGVLPIEVLEVLDDAGFCQGDRLEAVDHLAASQGDTTMAGLTATVLSFWMQSTLEI